MTRMLLVAPQIVHLEVALVVDQICLLCVVQRNVKKKQEQKSSDQKILRSKKDPLSMASEKGPTLPIKA